MTRLISSRTNSLSLGAGLGGSVLLHAIVLLPGLRTVMTATPEPMNAMHARFEPDHFRPETEPPLEPDDLRLGLEEGSPSTLTWIGHEQYEEHLARLAAFEQAAFSDAPGAVPSPLAPAPAPGGAPARPAADPAVKPGESPTQQTEHQPSAPDPGEPEDPPSARIVDATTTMLPAREQARAITPTGEQVALLVQAPVRQDEVRDQPRLRQQDLSPILLLAELARRAAEAQREAQPPSPQPAPPSAPAVPGSSMPGTPADKEADATSTIDVPLDQLKTGKPLAAVGLELQTRRPDFTTLILLTASPGNPLGEMHFGADGKVRLALILESSGDVRVDDAIRSSLYRWRARGTPLETLHPDETIDVRVRIVLSSRADR